jgi:hypothetical protein
MVKTKLKEGIYLKIKVIVKFKVRENIMVKAKIMLG